MCVNVLPTMPFEGLHTHTHSYTHKLNKMAVLKKSQREAGGAGGAGREVEMCSFLSNSKCDSRVGVGVSVLCARVERNICWSAGGH